MADLFDSPSDKQHAADRPEVVATYPYVGADGTLLYEVVRYRPKTFKQRRPDGRGGHQWNLEGIGRVLFRLPEVIAAVSEGRTVWVVEGEKDADALVRAGGVATCNAGGAGKWRTVGDAAEVLTGADVVIVADKDEPGVKHARDVAASLAGRARSVRIVQAAVGKDAHDHLSAGRDLQDFVAFDEDQEASDESVPSVDCDWPPMAVSTPGFGPPFPVDALPMPLRRWARAEAEATQTPVDLAALLSLVAVSTVAARRVQVQLTAAWSEPVNLFAIVALAPANRKSAVFAHATEPIAALERDLRASVRDEVSRATAARAVAEKTLRRLEDDAAKGKATADDVADAAARLARMEVPVLPQLTADDVTPEKLGGLLAAHNGRMAVLSAEGGIFGTISGRYSKVPNFEVFLKGHAGDTLRVDRQGAPGVLVERAALTVGLAIQPHVLREMAQVPGFREKGLIGRFMYSVPPSPVGSRTSPFAAIPMDDGIRLAFCDVIFDLHVALPEPTDPPRVLTLTPEAIDYLDSFERGIESRLGAGGDLAEVTDLAGKLVGLTGRLAALIELTTDQNAAEINESSMRAGIAIGEYALRHALVALGVMGADADEADAHFLYEWLKANGRTTFTKRDAYNDAGNRSRFKKASDVDGPLDRLADWGVIRKLPQPEERGAGRPSVSFEVHPAMSAQYAQNGQNHVALAGSVDSAVSAISAQECSPEAMLAVVAETMTLEPL